MAWISVDQKLIGGKLRTLHKSIGCSRNEAIGILVTLWLWGIDNSEMDGLISSGDREDIAEVLRPGISDNLDPETVVNCLIECGWIDEDEGRLYIHDWGDWRVYYNKYVRSKQSNRERQARFKDNHREDDNANNNVTSNVTNIEDGSSTKPKKEDKYGKEFEDFWSIYPKKADKGQAYKQYKARRNEGYSAEELMIAADGYKKQCEKNHTDKQYIKHAKTFLGSSLPFTDFLPSKQEESSPTNAQASGLRSM